jgi:hypothetical protein
VVGREATVTLRQVESTPLIPSSEHPPFGHAHFWERALSRRQMIAGTLGAAGAVAAAGLLKPVRAFAGTNPDPRPIPGGIIVAGQGWHVSGPAPMPPADTGPVVEMSTIYDFDGTIAAFTVQGTGTGRQGGVALPLAFDTDMRFMRGRYRGMDGRMYRGTFGFI